MTSFRASAENDRILLSVGPATAETLALYLAREGFEDEAREVWRAMEECCEHMDAPAVSGGGAG